MSHNSLAIFCSVASFESWINIIHVVDSQKCLIWWG
jgi:hypothetical protein